MRIAMFDPFSGAAGDMILAALIANGLDPEHLRRELRELPVSGYTLRVSPVSQHGVSGVHVDVDVAEDEHARDWATIRGLIAGSGLTAAVKTRALAIFGLLAAAEASVHGVEIERVHFHEVGGVDAIVDIVGAAIGFAALGIERVYCGPVRVGSGWVRAAHGMLPVPAPATAEILARRQMPIAPPLALEQDARAELLTPTGAAILGATAEFIQPAFTPVSTGLGFGTKELPWPNAIRMWIGDTADSAPASDSDPTRETDAAVVLEANIDDMNPQFAELLLERLFAAGAVDAWLTPITMKKGRPAFTVSAIAPESDRDAVANTLIEQSTTLGVRTHAVERVKAGRRLVETTTRWGAVRVKLRGWRGRVIDAQPEYDDCLQLARDSEAPIREIWAEARRQADVYIGVKWSALPNLTLLSESGTRQ